MSRGQAPVFQFSYCIKSKMHFVHLLLYYVATLSYTTTPSLSFIFITGMDDSSTHTLLLMSCNTINKDIYCIVQVIIIVIVYVCIRYLKVVCTVLKMMCIRTLSMCFCWPIVLLCSLLCAKDLYLLYSYWITLYFNNIRKDEKIDT